MGRGVAHRGTSAAAGKAAGGELVGVTVAPPWRIRPGVRWEHTDSGVWPAIGGLDNRDQSTA